jgi:hypothetical protein
MNILITGVGCSGKSTLREKIALDFPDQVISVDMDYSDEIPPLKNKIIVVESVHGLEKNPEKYDKILYLLPPKGHTIIWLRRGWTWFATGIVDLSEPQGRKKKYSLLNVPVILKILFRNILLSGRWVRADLCQIQEKLKDKTYVASSIKEGYEVVKSWITSYSNSGKLTN